MKEKKKLRLDRGTWAFIGAVLIAGPFALPLLWANPRYSRNTKLLWSLVVVLLTIALVVFSAEATKFFIHFVQP
jgi:uncharacterized membrane protein YccC